ncbi:MAG: FeoB-associated Cys-rich membrane protein [Clostridia bacterium]|nr:FeoB-associated Cys-rich membrane protein [Clostridia bacterium]
MEWYEYLLIVAAAAFVVGVIVWRIVRKKQGKSGCDECGGACANCSHCSACREKANKK